DGEPRTYLCPEKRFYPVQRMPTTEAAIDPGLTRDVYLVLGDQSADGAWAVRSYYKPLANWIWFGSLIMAIGGAVSLTDRRYRVGAAKRRIPNAVPAE
ncbi:MAG: cytochrome c-type biogenesis CcmF C-terminal domain-containing protein, partial [Pseudomonadota bacterium]